MRLRPEVIKLDRALTTDVDTDPAKAALIASFVRYARDINATVCAEGIETLEELDRLAHLDVAYGQGYGIARPAVPWATAAPAAVEACLSSFEAALSGPGGTGLRQRDLLMEVTRALAEVTTGEELDRCLPAIAELLHADAAEVVVGGDAGAGQVLVRPPGADGIELATRRSGDYQSELSLPLVHRGRTVGHLWTYRRTNRPWSRFEVGRGQLVASQLAAVVRSVGRSAAPDADAGASRLAA
jgi:GAF domain-containing protein